ncbi:PEGA domain-containing protein [Bacteroidota bacterium]
MFKWILFTFMAGICFISCDKEVSVSPHGFDISTGFVFVDSYPQGSQIYLNGRISGRVTPDSIKWLEEGNYEIFLRRPLFRDTSIFIDIVEGEINNVLIDYSENPRMRGTINCITSPSNAKVYLNDSLIESRTPCTIENLWPGYYNLKYEVEEHRNALVEVVVQSDEISLASVTMVDTTIWNDFTTDNSGIISDDLTCITIDANNFIWVGTYANGVEMFDGNSWTHFNMSSDGLPNDSITCITASDDGEIWLGTRNGFARYYNGTWYNYGMGFIEDIEIDDEGTKWIGSYGGLIKLTESTLTLYNTSSAEFPDNRITEVVIDQLGNKWLGTYGYGILKFNSNAVMDVYTRAQDGLPGDRISTGTQLLNGQFWFGHFPWSQEVGGLSYYNNMNWQSIFGLPSQLVEWIYADDSNNKWIATGNGLAKITGNGVITTFNYENTGLDIRHVKCITEDDNGTIWIATFGSGLIKLRKANL